MVMGNDHEVVLCAMRDPILKRKHFPPVLNSVTCGSIKTNGRYSTHPIPSHSPSTSNPPHTLLPI